MHTEYDFLYVKLEKMQTSLIVIEGRSVVGGQCELQRDTRNLVGVMDIFITRIVMVSWVHVCVKMYLCHLDMCSLLYVSYTLTV